MFWHDRFGLVQTLFAGCVCLTIGIFMITTKNSLQPDAYSTPMVVITSTHHLSDYAMNKVLEDASPVFGRYENIQSSASTWMSTYSDSAELVHMNIPGAHDAATWNYSTATQQALKHVTDLADTTSYPPEWFRCQRISLIEMLNAGVRAFDLRYAQDVTKEHLVFWHGPALQSQIATVESVLFGFFRWLADHPSEVLLLSFQYEANKAMGNVDSVKVQNQLCDTLTSPAAHEYISQKHDVLGTLGDVRGKIVLLKRFDLDLLPAQTRDKLPGVQFSPKDWTVNSPSIKLIYNSSPGKRTRNEDGVAYIEDYYRPLTVPSSELSLADNIAIKYNATEANLLRAAGMSDRDSHPNGLFWTFTSATNIKQDAARDVSITPEMIAMGNDAKGISGMNQRLLELLDDDEMKGKRLGLIMFDFLELPGDLITSFLSLRND